MMKSKMHISTIELPQPPAVPSAPIAENRMLPVRAVSLKRYLSFSGGVESTTMAILYGKGATAIVADTGDEESEMYERWKYVEQRLKEIHNGDFNIIYLHPEVIAKGIVCHTLDELVMAWKLFPSPRMRFCTIKLKIEPIDKFLSTQGECELMIGLNADEERVGNFGECKNVTYSCPLQDDGLTRDDCIEVLKAHDLMPDFPPYMQRGGCRKCMFRTKKEAKAKYFFDKAGFLEDMDFEEKLQDNRKKFYGINMNFKEGYRALAAECETEISMYGLEAIKSMYQKIQAHQPCGAFCHR